MNDRKKTGTIYVLDGCEVDFCLTKASLMVVVVC